MKLNTPKLLIFIIILLVCAFIITPQAREIDSERWFGIVRSYYDAVSKPGTQTYSGWKDGVKEEFGLTLKRLEFHYEFLDIKENESGKTIGIAFLLKMVAFCCNEDGDKKEVEMIRFVLVAIDKETEKIIGVKTLDQVGPTVTHGWKGLDV